MNKILMLIIFFGFSNSLTASGENIMTIGDVSKEKWNLLLSKKIFFGHQSVGNNIIHGIELLKTDYPWLEFNIKESQDLKTLDAPVFAHKIVGENGQPNLKLKDFQSELQNSILGGTEIAALKFCYVDFKKSTNVLKVFTRYKETIEEIKEKNPDILVVHFTVPLRTIQSGWKAWIKEIIGKPLNGVEDNITRNQYNKLLIKEYAKEGIVFDIAKFESTLPDGSRRQFKENGETYFSLAEVYSTDGGHLNELGSRYIAEKFLLFLLDQVIKSNAYAAS